MVQVLVLGPIGVTRPDGRPLRLGSPLMQRLIGALATEAGRPIGRDRLIEVLWGDSAPEGAGRVSRVRVRRVLLGSADGCAVASRRRVDPTTTCVRDR